MHPSAVQSTLGHSVRERASQRLVGWLFALAMSGVPALAHAGEPPPESQSEADVPEQTELVLIHVAPDRPEIRARLQAELGSLGFVSERLRLADDNKVLGPDLIERLPEEGAAAAIEIALTETRINLWVADGTTGKTLHRRLDLTSNPEFADARTLAISAVELLLASRLELGSSEVVEPIETPREPPPINPEDLPPSSDEPDEPPAPEPPMRAAISLAPLISGSPGGFGPSAHIEVAARWVPLERFALRFSLWVPTVGNRKEADAGSARLFFGMLFAEPQLRLPGGADWFHPELGLGLGFALTGITGEARDPYVSTNHIVAGFAGHTHLGLGFAVTRRLWIRIDGYLGVVQPQPKVIFLGETVARWGLPWGTGSFGIELWL